MGGKANLGNGLRVSRSTFRVCEKIPQIAAAAK